MNDNDSEERKPFGSENDGEQSGRSASEDRPTDPGERLRRLLAADDEPNVEPAPRPSPGETRPVDLTGPTDQTGPQASQGFNRHPTGEPDATGGWYSQDPQEEPPVTPDNARTRAIPVDFTRRTPR
jgi:hypothetical protein